MCSLQATPTVFNKAQLMNVGFVEVRSAVNPDCYIFHDVDMLPLDNRNLYVCTETPRHVGAYVNKWNYKFVFQLLF